MIDLTETIAKLSNFIALSEERAKEHFKESGLTETQIHYLEKIAELDNPTLTELSKQLRLSKPTVTVTIDKLVDKGFVIRVRSDMDRRSAHLHLTDKGVEFNTIHDVAHITIAKHLSKKVDNNDIEEFIRIINKFLD